MINFRNRDDVVPSAIILGSIIVTVAALIFYLVVVVPRPKAPTHGASKSSILDQVRLAKADAANSQAAIKPLVWQGDQDSVSATVLANLTNESNQRGLTLGAFRPQRITVLSGITEAPFTIQVSGPYHSVRSLIMALDQPGGKVVLQSVDIASSAQQSNEVTATVGLSAYLLNDPALLAPESTTKSPLPAAKAGPLRNRAPGSVGAARPLPAAGAATLPETGRVGATALPWSARSAGEASNG